MALLELKNVSKHFGAIHALNDVSLSLEPGQVVGLMGDNGAGKSTLVKIIAGNFRPTHGTLLRKGFGPFKILDYATMYRRAGQIFAELRSETRPRELVREMSGGQRQAVAIARTRIADARIVLMDEPTAAISVRQVAEVLNLIQLLRDRGIAIVLISHRMPDVFSVADRVVVLRRGRKVADKEVTASSPEEVTGLITGAIEHAL